MPNHASALVRFLGELRFDDLPEAVRARAELAFVDRLGCGLVRRSPRESFEASTRTVSFPRSVLRHRAQRASSRFRNPRAACWNDYTREALPKPV
jgi:2-methylcitrate dehydratase PrpD